MAKKKHHSIILTGSAANAFIAEAMVDAYGEKARENVEPGPALDAINQVLARRGPVSKP